jgi:2-dehydro-3-deoxy-D-arabinonate dehydratase
LSVIELTEHQLTEEGEMRYYQLEIDHAPHLVVEFQEATLADLTAVHSGVATLPDLLRGAFVSGTDLDTVAESILKRLSPPTYPLAQIEAASRNHGSGPRLARPIVPPEVWAAGVTYERSVSERRLESETPDIYTKVYLAERPEIFFKATPNRVVGPFEATGIRADSTWNVPEPELAFVLYGGDIVGYTIGNDASSRSIEGENPLYLPQAKTYDCCCAIGPCIASPATVGDPQNLEVSLTILREGQEVFADAISTGKMVRPCQDIADWLQRHNLIPDGAVVLTGTGIVPPSDFTLMEGDVCRITIQNIGTLEVGTTVV